MKILVVNDDSIHAPGIRLLAEAAARLGQVWVVAPEHQCSALSQKLTLREKLPLRKAEEFPVKVEAAYALDGTPVDCVKVALAHLMEEKPDWVFSGINNGSNTGFDIAYSATVGAAFEAARNGIPAIAFSILENTDPQRAEGDLLPLIRQLTEEGLGRGEIWNVNFPAGEGSGKILRDLPLAPVSLYQEQYIESKQPDGRVLLTCRGIPTPDSAIPEGTDSDAIRKGFISVGKLRSTGF